MGVNCFACFVAICAAGCFLMCYLILPTALTALYWYLLYHTSWAHATAIFSIIFFGLTLVYHLASVIIGSIVLCLTGTAAIIACPAIGLGGSLIILLTVVLIAVALCFVFGIGVLGLITSIHLLNTGAQQCPIEGADCHLLVILFGICMFSNTLRLCMQTPKKATPQGITLESPTNLENEGITPIHHSRVLVTTLLLDPLAHAPRRGGASMLTTSQREAYIYDA